MNKVILVGRLTRDPEIRFTAGEEKKAVAKFVVAVDRVHKQEGNPSADFISCTCFGKTAEFSEKYLRKGIKVIVEGRWQTGSYQKDGVTRYTNDCIIERLEFAESKKTSEQSQTEKQPETDENGFMNVPDEIDDELPFS